MQQNNSKKVRFKNFEGIDSKNSRSKSPAVYDINNFSISSEGALIKRQGFRCIHEHTDPIRDIWTGKIDGSFKYIYIRGADVYCFEDEDIYSQRRIAVLYTTSGHAQIFYYENSLFVLDDAGLFRIFDGGLHPVLGYVPLYGKNWGTAHPGEVNEPLNLLNRYARISYIAPADYTAMLPTGLPVKQVISVYKNGVRLDSSQYRYDDELEFISVPGIQENDRLTATVVFDVDISGSGIKNCNRASVFGSVNDSRLLLWNDEENVMFSSVYVSPESYAQSKTVNSNCTRLYFPADSSFVVGDGRYKPRAVTRHYDRLLIFTEGDAWMANGEELGTSNFPVMSINTSVGCASTLGSVLCGNSPFTVGNHDIFQWTSDTDELNECNVFSVSEQINDRLSDEFFENAIVFKDIYRNELWFHNKNAGGDVWIYNVTRKAWVRFSGIYADKFFDANGRVGFIRDGNIYVFLESCYADEDENPIEASVTVGSLDFGSSEYKRLSSYMIDTELDGSELTVSFVTDCGETVTDSIKSDKTRIMKTQRLNSGRFLYLEGIRITANGENRPLIRDIEITARQKRKDKR